MEWTAWIVPVVLVAGWILKQLANAQEENKRQEAAARPRERPNQPVKKPPDEIRRFLEEMRRQRASDRSDNPQVEPEPTAQVVRPKPKPVVVQTPRKPPPRPRTPQILEAIPVQVAPVPVTPDRTTVRPATVRPATVRPATVRPRASEPAPLQAPALTPTVQLTPTAQIAARILKPTPPAVKQLLELIKDRQNLGAAFLLREVLDGPVSKRRRRR